MSIKQAGKWTLVYSKCRVCPCDGCVKFKFNDKHYVQKTILSEDSLYNYVYFMILLLLK